MSTTIRNLPEGWQLSTLDEVAEIIRGVTFPSGEKQSEHSVGSVMCLRTSNIQEEIEWDDVLYIPSGYVKSEDRWLQPSDTLISMANSYELVGKVALLKRIPDKVTFGGFIAAVRTRGIDPLFLFFSLREPETKERIRRSSSRTVNIANISLKTLHPTEILVPPIAEQRRIVAKIEALQERSRKAREALAEVGPLLEQFRQSLLAAAFRGDLTADWRAANPNVELASELLNRIRQERRRHWEESEQAKFEKKNTEPKNDKWKEKYPESQPFKFDGELPEIPQTWEWANWDSLTMWVTYGFTRPMPHVETGPMIVTAKNVRNEGLRLDVVDHTTEEAFAELNPKDLPIPGDILIIKDGATTGRAALVPDDIGEFCINQSVGVVWLKYSPMHRLFLLRWVQSPLIQKMIQEAMAGMAMPHLSVTDFKAMPVPIPPLEEQLAICEALEFSLGTADSLRASTFESESELTQLDQSILAKAFRGELVPQDPSDEPASELLARIRSAREQTKPAKRTRSESR
jgi:type I restriction enzyme S subunit